MNLEVPNKPLLPKVKRLVKRVLRKIKEQGVSSPQAEQQSSQLPVRIESTSFSAPLPAKQTLQVVSTKKNSQIIGSNWLIDFKDNQHSEHGEDGIIAKIFQIMQPENKWVCEFGAHDPEIISNTWHLIHKENWNAVLIEADDGCFEKLKKYYQDSNSVHCIQSMISYEGKDRLDNILKDTPIPANMDFMIIDIDGNDYHVWEAIETYKAKVLMIEFNASIPSDVSFVQSRNLSVNQGSSLAAMVSLAKRKGYKLIAVTAWNAFFIKDEYFHLFFNYEAPLDQMYVYPAKNPIWMRAFQLYDGTIFIAPWNEMLWHDVELKVPDYQFLPESYRKFSRKLANKNYVREKNGKKTATAAEDSAHLGKIFAMPANVISKFAQNKFSRYGEDGIVEKLVEMISAQNLYFVDVGAGDGTTYSRSRNFSENHNWAGLMLDDDQDVLGKLKKEMKGLVKIKVAAGPSALEGENSLDEILMRNAVPQEFDLLLLNSYGMEYYLWESLKKFSPNIVAVQFNPTVPNDIKFVQSEDFSIHQGCSLKALSDLAQYKNYMLVGVTMGTAFFVKSKFAYRFLEILGLKYAELDEIFAPVLMQMFQLYDGTIALQGLNRLLWQPLRIDEEKLQVIPSALRTFHQFADKEDKSLFYRDI
jgi:hypothetical protein